jgi:hypothetical protein
MNRVVLFLSAGVCAVWASGCGDQYDGRKAVSGKVTLVGKALEKGQILFEPLDGQGSVSGSAIAHGEYALDRKGGLKPGKYRVRITAADGKTPASDEEAAAPGGSTNIVSVDLIPPEWNVNSTQQIEVTSGGDNKFDFAIPNAVDPSKKKAPRRGK